jgi:hypothetical protein
MTIQYIYTGGRKSTFEKVEQNYLIHFLEKWSKIQYLLFR